MRLEFREIGPNWGFDKRGLRTPERFVEWITIGQFLKGMRYVGGAGGAVV